MVCILADDEFCQQRWGGIALGNGIEWYGSGLYLAVRFPDCGMSPMYFYQE